MIHIYEGNGKGKTTAAYGLALRASGYGLSVITGGFLKPADSGEIKALSSVCNKNAVHTFGGCYGFFGCMNGEDEKKCREEIREGFFKLTSLPCDLLILDEIIDSVNFGIIEEDEFIEAIQKCPAKEIVLTGRNPSAGITALADYHTHFEKIKHPYDKGIEARRGIEF